MALLPKRPAQLAHLVGPIQTSRLARLVHFVQLACTRRKGQRIAAHAQAGKQIPTTTPAPNVSRARRVHTPVQASQIVPLVLQAVQT